MIAIVFVFFLSSSSLAQVSVGWDSASGYDVNFDAASLQTALYAPAADIGGRMRGIDNPAVNDLHGLFDTGAYEFYPCDDVIFSDSFENIPDNGCEFVPDPATIYVSTPANAGVDDAGCGDWDDPCATITNGLSRAANAAGKEFVRVSAGQFSESVILIDGISVLGGHSPDNWKRNPEIFVSAINGTTANPMSADRVAVLADGITTTTEFSGFSVNGESAGAGGNSIGIYILDSTEALLVRGNVILAGAGGDGISGDPGGSGLNGIAGSAGIDSVVCDDTDAICVNNGDRDGGQGGSFSCGATDVSGGQGGTSNNPAFSERSGPGQPGLGSNGGGGGIEASNFFASVVDGDGCLGNSEPLEPGPGGAGDRGADGVGGQSSMDTDGRWNTVDLRWEGVAGAQGDSADHGSGAGGGGAGNGIDATDSATGDHVYFGASGGGGGSGGCAGQPGQAGTTGGGSFAIQIAFSGVGPTNASDMPSLIDNHMVRNQGGQGGHGGDGGTGGDPGAGAPGGDGLEDDGNNNTRFDFCFIDGAAGADGGRGGHAGGGAGGNGGVSYDIFIANSNDVDPGYNDTNTFEFDAATATSGAGGLGGSSSNTSTGFGDSGNDGAFGTVLSIP